MFSLEALHIKSTQKFNSKAFENFTAIVCIRNSLFDRYTFCNKLLLCFSIIRSHFGAHFFCWKKSYVGHLLWKAIMIHLKVSNLSSKWISENKQLLWSSSNTCYLKPFHKCLRVSPICNKKNPACLICRAHTICWFWDRCSSVIETILISAHALRLVKITPHIWNVYLF